MLVDSSIFPYSPLFIPIIGCHVTDQILTLKEVADYLKLAEKTAYKLAAAAQLPGFKVGGSWRFKQTDIDQWIEDQKQIEKDKKS